MLGVCSHGCSKYGIKRRVPRLRTGASAVAAGIDRPLNRRAKWLLLWYASLCRTGGSRRCPLAAAALEAEWLNGRRGETSRGNIWLARRTRGSVRINDSFLAGTFDWAEPPGGSDCFSPCSQTFGIFSHRRRVCRRLGARRKTLSFASPPTRGLSRVIVVSCPLCKNCNFFFLFS